ncbi:hypothetical protein COW81_01060 [Candidatus Campbellbacteria bacterium CG22_combo_CG10-13_8_21_14_all_36_13]|uniref:Cytochrome C biogenesis protein transmembrane domain-containing protein n=1 Tax=Candidatus Campbellbacteria bacterium CG22_combo_CG10-13_8_21_14_all_36_13 TaxID=1974529 RepID=A0A2H0DZ77_9BACT|nr:MAG: hypothetical protein COW81_01060 [Candidatus Campbellbacteria bacterium CG22_combo_CG10-13_8_21_14_all_36_13]
MKKYFLLTLTLFAYPAMSQAHCPLCTIGVGALAVFAASIGVPSVVVATFIGGFAMALGLWLKGMLKKKYIPFQDDVVTVLIYASTVLPLIPMLREYKPLYVSFLGEYGTTYTVDVYLIGVLFGAVAVIIASPLSNVLKKMNNKRIVPFQGMIITFLLLTITSVLLMLAI